MLLALRRRFSMPIEILTHCLPCGPIQTALCSLRYAQKFNMLIAFKRY